MNKSNKIKNNAEEHKMCEFIFNKSQTIEAQSHSIKHRGNKDFSSETLRCVFWRMVSDISKDRNIFLVQAVKEESLTTWH
jgi:predicted DNA-binding ribbon-helix-helix protein